MLWINTLLYTGIVYLESQLKVGSKAAAKNKKRHNKKSVHRDEAVEKETVDFNYMLTELKKQLEVAKSSKVFKYRLLFWVSLSDLVGR